MMRRVFYGIGGVAAALALAAAILVATFDVEKHTARLEAAFSEATGMQVAILGGMRLHLIPRASLSLENLFIQNRGTPVLSARLAVTRIRLLPLLWGDVRIRTIVVNAPRVFITRERTGRFNFEAPARNPRGKEAAAVLPDVARIFVTDGDVLYRDETTDRKIEAQGCNLVVRDFSADGDEPAGDPSFTCDLSCREAGTKEAGITDVRAVVKAGGGTIAADPVTMKILGGDGRGSVRRVTEDGGTVYAVELGVTGLRFEKVLAAFGRKPNVFGALDLTSHLTMRGRSTEELTRTAQGTVSLKGQGLRLENLDVDRLLEKVERSQNFNLIDVGAFLVAGPLGTLLTKGYDFGSIYHETPGAKSAIRLLVSDWDVRDGVATARDAAFTTEKNRFALRGKLDFVRRRFEDLSLAVLDAKGCALTSQKIHGDFRDPQIDEPFPPPTILGAFISLLRMPLDLIQEHECEVFYRGSLGQP